MDGACVTGTAPLTGIVANLQLFGLCVDDVNTLFGNVDVVDGDDDVAGHFVGHGGGRAIFPEEEKVVEVLAALAEALLTLETDGDGVLALALGVAAHGCRLLGLGVQLVENFEVAAEWAGVVGAQVNDGLRVGVVERAWDDPVTLGNELVCACQTDAVPTIKNSIFN